MRFDVVIMAAIGTALIYTAVRVTYWIIEYFDLRPLPPGYISLKGTRHAAKHRP